MDEESRKKLEYEEQFFGMSSRFFAISFKNFVKEELDSKISLMIENFKNKLISQSKNPEEFESAIRVMESELKDEYNTNWEKFFNEIMCKISNVIEIPQHIILKEDLPAKEGVNKDLNSLKEEIKNLEGIYKSLLYVKEEMLDELEQADSSILLMESLGAQKKLEFEVLPLKEIVAVSEQNNLLFENGS